MNVQDLPSGKKLVSYGDPVDYQSPLLIDENLPSIVTYKCAVTGDYVGKVYRTQDSRWWLSTIFFSHGTPIEVFSKIEGFFLLNNLHKQKHEH
jgi:hypothetical protein